MSEESVEVVRFPAAVRATARRRIDERLGLRFPRLFTRLARAVQRLPLHSRLRNAAIRHAAQRAIEARNRDDTEVWLLLFHPHCRSIWPAELRSLGVEPDHSSHEARARFEQKWRAEWGEYGFTLEEVVVVGPDRGVLMGRVNGSGPASGVRFDSDWACLFTIEAGQVIREEHFFERHRALEAAGLSE
jgi:ketosteroid isomerase-like protein